MPPRATQAPHQVSTSTEDQATSSHLKPNLARFNGFQEPDVIAYLDNYELVCSACSIDPSRSFPNFAPAGVTSRLKAKGATYQPKTWNSLRPLIIATYAQPINKVKLQAELAQRRQGEDESVSQFADAIDDLATKLGNQLDDVVGVFVAGLSDMIADGGMKARTFATFQEAIETARIIEQNCMSRKPKAAVPMKPLTPLIPLEQSEAAQILAALAPYAGRPAAGPLSIAAARQPKTRPWMKRQMGVHGSNKPNKNSRPLALPPNEVQCSFCGYKNHEERDCRIKMELDKRRRDSGMVIVLSDYDNPQGPLLTTNSYMINGAEVLALVDTGATASFVKYGFLAATQPQQLSCIHPTPARFKTGSGHALVVRGYINAIVMLGSHTLQGQQLIVADGLPFDAIIGTDILETLSASVNIAKRRLTLVNGDTVSLENTASCILSIPGINDEEHSDDELKDLFEELTIDADNSEITDAGTLAMEFGKELSLAQLAQLQKLVDHHLHVTTVFAPAHGGQPCNFPPFTLDTGDAAPIYVRPYRIPYSEREAMQRHVDEYCKRGWIRASSSSWSSPTLIVRRNGKERFCVDYRKLNAVTVPDRFPAANLQECIDKLAGKKFFSLLDADAAYHQCSVDQAACEKLAFSTHTGIYEPTVLLFGPRNAPAYFQRNIMMLLSGIPNVHAYLDDIMVATETFGQHLEALTLLLERCASANLRLKMSKCQLAMTEIKYLGFIVCSGGIRPDENKVAAIMELAAPNNIRTLRAFLGMTGYYQRFIKNYASIAKPLYQLTQHGRIYSWTSEHENAFNSLKHELSTIPLLQLPDMDREFELMTDASTTAVGAILQQREIDGSPRPVAFASRVLLPAETRYFTQELECLAVIFGLRRFREYLLGRHFIIITDHQALLSVLSKTSPSARITRWALALQEFDCSIVHVPGRSHMAPDALSRLDTLATLVPINQSIWLSKQADDAFCSTTISHITSLKSSEVDSPHIDGFQLDHSGILVLHTAGQAARIVVPLSLVDKVLELVHGAHGAHQGINRTTALIAQSYFWPGWRRSVSDYVNSCASCQQRKTPIKKTLPRMKITSSHCNDLIAMDLQGPLPTTVNGNSYILVIMDIFSKFVQAVAIRDATAQSIAQALLANWIGIFHAPRRILSDNGANMSATLLEDLFVLLGVHKLWTSPYHPQGDGQVERFNRTLNSMLSHFMNERQDNWDTHLPLLNMAYNSTYNYTIRQSPHYIMLGRRPPSLTDALLRTADHMETTWGTRARNTAHLAYTAAYDAVIRKNQIHDTENAAIIENFQGTQHSVGDVVLILDSTTPAGLKPKYRRQWKGPFIIKTVTGPLSYIVRSPNGTQEYRVHAEHVKTAYPPPNGWPFQTDLSVNQQQHARVSALQTPTSKTNDNKNNMDVDEQAGVSYQTSSPAIQAPKSGRTPITRELTSQFSDAE